MTVPIIQMHGQLCKLLEDVPDCCFEVLRVSVERRSITLHYGNMPGDEQLLLKTCHGVYEIRV